MIRVFYLIFFLAIQLHLLAQMPQAINFQAIARDAKGALISNKYIGLQLTILDGADGGKAIYQETHGPETNSYGSFALLIGTGKSQNIPLGVSFEDIPWYTGKKYMKLDFETEPKQTFEIPLGIIELATVPYAFSAQSVANIRDQNAQRGDVMVFDGSNWVPGDTIQHAHTTSMINQTGAKKGDVLVYDGANWIPGSEAISIVTTSIGHNVSLDDDVILADAKNNDVTIRLPDPSKFEKELIVRVKDATNDVWLVTNSTEFIHTSGADLSDTIALNFHGDYVSLISDGTNWYVIGMRSNLSVYAVYDGKGTLISLPNGKSVPIGFNNVSFDPYGTLSIGTQSVFTVPMGQGGLYSFSIMADVGGSGKTWAAGSSANIMITKNGGSPRTISTLSVTASRTQDMSLNGSMVEFLEEGDEIGFLINQNSGKDMELRKRTRIWISKNN